MKLITSSILILFSLTIHAQDKKVITSRKNVPLQAVLDIDSRKDLYVGQEYTFTITTSGTFDIQLTAENAKIRMMEESKNSTGGLEYKVTPIDTGILSITIGNQIDEKKTVSLKMQTFRVINYPVPPLQLKGMQSGQIITTLKDSVTIQCMYPKETGIYDNYEIKSWSATVGAKSFNGHGNLLSEELIRYINQVDNEFLLLEVNLGKNKTGHLKSEGIYLIRRSGKNK